MKELYEVPTLSVSFFEENDILTASGGKPPIETPVIPIWNEDEE